MSTAFERALARTVGVEGNFSDDPKDSGGATRFGITERVARAYGYVGPMSSLPFPLATEIYRQSYWSMLKLDRVSDLSEDIAQELFDTAVNVGQQFAALSLQRSLNVLNRNENDFADIAVDGLIGQVTLASLSALLQRRGGLGEVVLLRMLNSLQGAHYVTLAESRSKDEEFLFGWFAQRVG